MPRQVFIKALKEVNNNKNYREKAKQTKAYASRLPEMQRYTGLSKEKRDLLYKTLTDNNNEILHKGAIVYVNLLEVADQLIADLEDKNIDCALINSKVSTKGRKKVADWFMESPNNKVVVITKAGSASVSLNATNEIILYDCPKGGGAYNQAIGRICRNFGNFDDFNIHFIIIEETIDEYMPILLSSKKELEMEILHADFIPVKETTSFDQKLLKLIRQRMLWKTGKSKRKPPSLEQ